MPLDWWLNDVWIVGVILGALEADADIVFAGRIHLAHQ